MSAGNCAPSANMARQLQPQGVGQEAAVVAGVAQVVVQGAGGGGVEG